MVTKPSDLLSRLPSVNELLEKPPIRALADRWNRSVVASGVRSFLDELRSDLERRAADVHLPSLRELAERAARHVALLQQSSVRPAINASGQFFGPDWNGAPLADAALERIVSLGSGFVLDTHEATHGDVAATLCRLTGAEAATVVGSYSGAVWLTLAALAAGKNIVVARGEVGDLEVGCSLSIVAASAAVSLCEVGSVNRTPAADYEAAVTHETAAILRHLPENYRVAGESEPVELEALVGLARDRELPLIDLLGAVPLVDELPAIGAAVSSVAASVAAGAHVVVARGNGLVGGPRCGILVGTRGLVHRVESHPLFAAWRTDPATRAAVQATLALYDDPQQLRQAIPLFQLLSASVENLRQRAERLAPQIAQADDVESAEAVATENCLGLARYEIEKMPSYAIALSPVGGDVARLDQRLRSAPVPIVGREVAGRLLLDLRTVLPRQDQRLVEIVAGPWDLPAKTVAETAATPGI
ncbi:MAG: L-seryl-tRNA(Sec) selenium transferase [Pirellulales bacterium]